MYSISLWDDQLNIDTILNAFPNQNDEKTCTKSTKGVFLLSPIESKHVKHSKKLDDIIQMTLEASNRLVM